MPAEDSLPVPPDPTRIRLPSEVRLQEGTQPAASLPFPNDMHISFFRILPYLFHPEFIYLSYQICTLVSMNAPLKTPLLQTEEREKAPENRSFSLIYVRIVDWFDYKSFLNSSATNCTFGPMITWMEVLLGRITPLIPADLIFFSSTAV